VPQYRGAFLRLRQRGWRQSPPPIDDLRLAALTLGRDRLRGPPSRHQALDPKTLWKLQPKLIIGKITGFGSENDRIAYDLILQAETGFMSMNGTPESGPTKMPVALIDVLAAHQLKEGLLLALLQKESHICKCCFRNFVSRRNRLLLV
jgi:hypothetical protein